jgi:hypothetical protein
LYTMPAHVRDELIERGTAILGTADAVIHVLDGAPTNAALSPFAGSRSACILKLT